MPATDLTLRLHAHEVLRESDARMLLVLEITTTDGQLAGLSIVDPRDYETNE